VTYTAVHADRVDRAIHDRGRRTVGNAGIGHHAKRPFLVVGFAAETQDLLKNAGAKLARKGLDAIVVNDVAQAGIGFDSADNEVAILSATGETHVAHAPKAQIAAEVLDEVARLRAPATAASEA